MIRGLAVATAVTLLQRKPSPAEKALPCRESLALQKERDFNLEASGRNDTVGNRRPKTTRAGRSESGKQGCCGETVENDF